MAHTRLLDTVCRIYKNSDNEVIAIDEVSVTVDHSQLQQGPRDDSGELIQKIHVYTSSITKSRSLLFLSTGASRVVSSIQMIGKFTSLEENSGDFLIVKWDSENTTTNNVEISLKTAGVAVVGDTV